jgi:hypothetical protein
VFVYAMLTMALSGAGIAAITGVETSVVMGGLAGYLVFTAFTAVRPSMARPSVNLGTAVIAFVLAASLANLGARALPSPSGAIEGLPAPMAFVFAAVATLAGVSDVRLLMRPVLPPRAKLTRHLWRMCVALFVASASFFLGQAQVIPAPLRHPVLLALPVLTPLGALAFWAWRVRRWRTAMPVAVVSDATTA